MSTALTCRCGLPYAAPSSTSPLMPLAPVPSQSLPADLWEGAWKDAFWTGRAAAFVEAFQKNGVPITMEEARAPMGLRKDLHIKRILEMPSVRTRWLEIKGKEPTEKDAEMVFKDFVPLQLSCLPKYTDLIPGTAETVQRLRKEFGLKIGNSTGFQRVMVDVLLKAAQQQGYDPDTTVAGDEVDQPRPYPYMVFRNMEKLGIRPVHAVVKVDDTVSGVGEGLNAGCWAVGVANWSNYVNIDSLEQYRRMSKGELEKRRKKSREILQKSGAHYVIDDLTELPEVVDDINRRLAAGEAPPPSSPSP